MNYEQKYKEAVRRAKVFYEMTESVADKEWLSNVFPELTENDDEGIRKEIIRMIKYFHEKAHHFIYRYPVKDMLAWAEKQKPCNGEINNSAQQQMLKIWFGKGKCSGIDEIVFHPEKFGLQKQGEQKPIIDFKADDCYVSEVDGEIYKITSTDKVEPRFHEGDWVVNKRGIVEQIVRVGSKSYKTNYNSEFGFNLQDNYHLWTIQDAKDGDVLVVNGDTPQYMWIGIFKEHTGVTFSSHCHYNFGMNEFVIATARCKNHGSGKYNDIHPATKEQRDTLFAKMKEAGYEWDADKKELKKVEQKSDEWSKEDEEQFNNCLGAIRYTFNEEKNITKLSDWLKSLKNRVLPQPKQEWSEEDEQMRQKLILFISSPNTEALLLKDQEQQFLDWLKSLRH